MSSWTAIVPFKTAGLRKTRLAPDLSPAARDRLAQTMFDHVIDVLDSCPRVGRIAVLSETAPDRAALDWLVDQGRGLNAELQALSVAGPRLILHADLPLVTAADVAALLTAATDGIAIAPDRHGTGVNALALAAGAALTFAFGPDSYARHHALAVTPLMTVRRDGLALDVDTPDDLAEAVRRGFRPEN